MTTPFKFALLNEKQRVSFSFIVFVNIILSVWLIVITPTINSDGIFYLKIGQTYLDSGLNGALSAYRWPFYSIAFATLSEMSFLSLTGSAYVINTLGFVVITYAFLEAIAEMGGDRKTQLIALFIILFQPLYANYRATLTRDPIFLGFMLMSLVQLLCFSRTPKIKFILGWLIYSCISFLARPEAFIIAFFSPLSLMLNFHSPFRENLRQLGQFAIIPFFILMTFGFFLYLTIPDTVQYTKPIAETKVYVIALTELNEKMEDIATNISDIALKHTAKEDAIVVTYAIYFTLLFINILRALTLPYFSLLIYGVLKKNHIGRYGNKLMPMAFIASTFFYLTIFTLTRQFTIERYSFHLVLLLMLYVPFIVNYILEINRENQLLKLAFTAIAMGYFLDTIINTNYKKSYIADAASWAITNSLDKSLVTNIDHVAYFGQKFGDKGVTESDQKIVANEYKKDHLYLVNPKDKMLEKTIQDIVKNHGEIVHTMPSDYGNTIIFFRKKISKPTEIERSSKTSPTQ